VASIAKIAVSAATYAIDRPYDYQIPEEMYPMPDGVRVIVTFGAGNRRVEGLVLSVEEKEQTEKPRRGRHLQEKHIQNLRPGRGSPYPVK